MDFHEKISLLIDKYKKSIPHKINEIVTICEQLNAKWDNNVLVDLHCKVHALHGSAAMYGFTKLEKSAETFEFFLKNLLKVNPSEDQIARLSQFCQMLLDAADIKNKTLYTQNKNELLIQNHMIYYLAPTDDKDSLQKLHFEQFGYITKILHDVESFKKILDESLPELIIVDIKCLNEELEEILKKIKSPKLTLAIPIFFLGESDNFLLHLQAVRAGGDGYFPYPFKEEEIITKLALLHNEDKDPYKVLLIEDEPDVAQVYETILQYAGIATMVINQPVFIDKALHEFHPDLILTDIYMPICSGLELVKIIRQRDAYVHIPIIFLSMEENPEKQLYAMSMGADDVIKKSMDPGILISTIKNRIKRYHALQTLIMKDHLTGVLNHNSIIQELESELKLANRAHQTLTVAIIDIDNCQKINDDYGYIVGDRVIKSLSLMLCERLRKSDLIGRYSSGSFLMVLPNTTVQSALTLINEFKEYFSQVVFNNLGESFLATFSAGIASFPPCLSVESFIHTASEALLKAKMVGGNCIFSDYST
jgi:diguanylate cyclase (GGDEF)-like protein